MPAGTGMQCCISELFEISVRTPKDVITLKVSMPKNCWCGIQARVAYIKVKGLLDRRPVGQSVFVSGTNMGTATSFINHF
jgi:hypothetical protein